MSKERKLKPMTAMKVTDADIRFPVYASYKLDGIRAFIHESVVKGRSMKALPNWYVQRLFSSLPAGTDGELIMGSPTAKDVYRKTNSAVMSHDGFPDITYYVFDNAFIPAGFKARYFSHTMTSLTRFANVVVLPQTLVNSLEELLKFEAHALEQGYEGVMIRSVDGKYKYGKSTVKEGIMLKVKRYEDAEAKIVGTEAWEHNANEATTNELGRTKRSSHKENKVALDILGKLNVVGLAEPFEGIAFDIGTGFDGADDETGERGQLWKVRDSLIGKIVKFKYFPVGVKDKPRHPVFLGFRDEVDSE